MGNTARETNNPGWRSKQHSEEAETRLDLRYWSIRIYWKNTFQRRRDINADLAEDIAINNEGGAFNVFFKIYFKLQCKHSSYTDFESRDQRVALSKNDLPAPSLTDTVQ